jgi:hypothetical protein
MAEMGRYTLDTLQIFFSWDDDLYTYFKGRGLGSAGLGSRKLPLVYTDNCESTAGLKERKRKYVIDPKFFGLTPEELGWKRTERETELVIPAEKPEVGITTTRFSDTDLLSLSIITRVGGVEQYHLEYSSMSEFGRIYKNWATFYLPLEQARDLADRLASFSDVAMDPQFLEESKQAQREKFIYLSVGVRKYNFSYSGLDYAKRFFETNGVTGSLPSLAYDDSDAVSRELMDPLLKIGIIQTKSAEGFEERKAQVAIKLSQPKMTTTKRGVRGRAKGRILENGESANFVVVGATDFATKIGKVCSQFKGPE